jgi:Rrf2 family transcriptional regulator, cysteine metabolism repressor
MADWLQSAIRDLHPQITMVSQKCQYAIRAVFELARRRGQGPVKISDIAEAQAIPLRFLQVILNQLRRGGFIESRRGAEGGYFLSREPDGLTVGKIVEFIEGPLVPVACMVSTKAAEECSLHGRCVFTGMWQRAAKAMSDVYNRISFQDLVDDDKKSGKTALFAYSI